MLFLSVAVGDEHMKSMFTHLDSFMLIYTHSHSPCIGSNCVQDYISDPFPFPEELLVQYLKRRMKKI